MKRILQLSLSAALFAACPLISSAEVGEPVMPASTLADGETYVLMNHNTPKSYFVSADDGAVVLVTDTASAAWKSFSFTAKKMSDGVFQFIDANGLALGCTIDKDGQRQNLYFSGTSATWNVAAGDYANFYKLTLGNGNIEGMVGEPAHLNTANNYMTVSVQGFDIYYDYNNPFDEDSRNFCFCKPDAVARYIAQQNLYNYLKMAYTALEAGENAALSAGVASAEAVYNNAASTPEQMNDIAATLPPLIYDAQLAGASKEHPVDFTSFIVNPNFDVTGGWQGDPSISTGDSEAEKFWTNFNVYQDITGLPAGLYGVLCQGFYRAGGPNEAAAAKDADTEALNAYLYANDDSVQMQSIFTAADALTIGVSTNYGMIPNNMNEGHQWFAAGNYTGNEVTTLVTGDGGTIRIGIKKSTTLGSDWTLFDSFKLMYYGNTADVWRPMLTKLLASVDGFKGQSPFPDMGNTELDALDEAEDAAQTTSDNTSATAAELKKAYDDLKAAYDDAQTSVSKYAELKDMLDKAADTMDKFSEVADELSDYQMDIDFAYGGKSLTNAQCQEAIDKLKELIEKTKSDAIQEGKDCSFLIANAGFDNGAAEWTSEPAAGLANSEVEFWCKTFNIHQTITGIPNGKYTLKCQGFFRPLNGTDSYTQYQDGKDNNRCLLYANTQEQKIENICAEVQDEGIFLNNGEGGYWPFDFITGDGKYMPLSTDGARAYFDAEKYDQNSVSVVVTDNKLTVGAKLDDATGYSEYWCVLDNFRLTYDGSSDEVMQDAIDELIAKATKLAESPMTASVKKQLNDAITAGQNVSGNALAVCEQLNAAIALGQEAIAKYQPLGDAFGQVETAAAELDVQSAAAKAEFENAVNDIRAKYNAGDYTNDEVPAAIDELWAALSIYKMGDVTGSDENPADVTFLILNPDFIDSNADNWTVSTSTGTPGFIAGEIEFYNRGFNIFQDLKGVKNGTYKLSVTGYYKNGFNENNREAVLYANDKQTPLLAIVQDANETPLYIANEDPSDWASDQMAEGYGYVPNSMTGASCFFDAGNYAANDVYVEVKDNHLVVGIKKEAIIANDWTIFTHFTLTYYGENSIVGVNEVPDTVAEATVISTAYYDLNGRRISRPSKGINLVKTTYSDGHVKTSKILVR